MTVKGISKKRSSLIVCLAFLLACVHDCVAQESIPDGTIAWKLSGVLHPQLKSEGTGEILSVISRAMKSNIDQYSMEGSLRVLEQGDHDEAVRLFSAPCPLENSSDGWTALRLHGHAMAHVELKELGTATGRPRCGHRVPRKVIQQQEAVQLSTRRRTANHEGDCPRTAGARPRGEGSAATRGRRVNLTCPDTLRIATRSDRGLNQKEEKITS
ncbi:MAG: hypothetical protein ACI8XO_003989 [Verrucomicrobiales bacterium]|jgi:hypothetical protein